MMPVIISSTHIVLAYVSVWFIIPFIKQRNDAADIVMGIVCLVLVGFFVNVTFRKSP
jgi:hypothetical protein